MRDYFSRTSTLPFHNTRSRTCREKTLRERENAPKRNTGGAAVSRFPRQVSMMSEILTAFAKGLYIFVWVKKFQFVFRGSDTSDGQPMWTKCRKKTFEIRIVKLAFRCQLAFRRHLEVSPGNSKCKNETDPHFIFKYLRYDGEIKIELLIKLFITLKQCIILL